MSIINPIIPVVDLSDPRLDIYARLSEVQLAALSGAGYWNLYCRESESDRTGYGCRI